MLWSFLGQVTSSCYINNASHGYIVVHIDIRHYHHHHHHYCHYLFHQKKLWKFEKKTRKRNLFLDLLLTNVDNNNDHEDDTDNDDNDSNVRFTNISLGENLSESINFDWRYTVIIETNIYIYILGKQLRFFFFTVYHTSSTLLPIFPFFFAEIS